METDDYICAMRKILLYAVFILALIGCGRGCTVSEMVDSFETTRTIEGVKVIVKVSKFKSNTYHLLRSPGNRKSTYYSFSYDIKIGSRPWLKEADYHEAAENASAEEGMNLFEMDFSPDKTHFSIGRYYKIFHMLPQGKPFMLVKDEDKLMGEKPDWNTIPSTPQLVKEIFTDENQNRYTDASLQTLSDVIKENKPANEFDFLALENYKCKLSEYVLDSARVSQNKKVSKWKNKAYSIVTDTLTVKENLLAVSRLALHLNEPEIFKVMDEFVGRSTESPLLYYISKRPFYSDFNRHAEQLMSNVIIAQIENGRAYGADARFYFPYAMQLKERSLVEKCIRGLITEKESSTALSYIEPNYHKFTKMEQGLIIIQCLKVIDADPTFSWPVMSFVKTRIPCETFFELRRKYPDYKNEAPPPGCKES